MMLTLHCMEAFSQLCASMGWKSRQYPYKQGAGCYKMVSEPKMTLVSRWEDCDVRHVWTGICGWVQGTGRLPWWVIISPTSETDLSNMRFINGMLILHSMDVFSQWKLGENKTLC